MKSDKSFFDFLGSRSGLFRVALILLAGIVLILISSGFRGSSEGEVSGEVSLEEEVAEACSSIESVGRCRVMITYGEEGEVFAVAVLCEGAGSDRVRSDVVQLCTSLFGIGANRVSVLKIK